MFFQEENSWYFARPVYIFYFNGSTFLYLKGQAVLRKRGQKSIHSKTGSDEKENLTFSLADKDRTKQIFWSMWGNEQQTCSRTIWHRNLQYSYPLGQQASVFQSRSVCNPAMRKEQFEASTKLANQYSHRQPGSTLRLVRKCRKEHEYTTRWGSGQKEI